jgi:hypothetical protein
MSGFYRYPMLEDRMKFYLLILNGEMYIFNFVKIIKKSLK